MKRGEYILEVFNSPFYIGIGTLTLVLGSVIGKNCSPKWTLPIGLGLLLMLIAGLNKNSTYSYRFTLDMAFGLLAGLIIGALIKRFSKKGA